MTEQALTLTVTHHDLVTLLEATLPDGPGYGRRAIDQQAHVSDIHGTPVLTAGQPSTGRGLIIAGLSETAMTLETLVWDGLEQEASSMNVVWGSRHGIITTTETNEQSTTLELHNGGRLYEHVIDATGLGPRATYTHAAEVPVQQKLLDAIGPGAEETTRRAALDELSRLAARPMPEVSAHLAAGRVRFMALSLKLFSVDGMVEQELFWIDTPAGILVPQSSGGLFTRTKYALAIMPPWAAWQNILAYLPNTQDIELWHDLADDTAGERVLVDASA